MKLKLAQKKILEYLDKYGSVNTFRLSRHLKINRNELINMIKELTEEGLTEFKRGVVTMVKGTLTERQKQFKVKDPKKQKKGELKLTKEQIEDIEQKLQESHKHKRAEDFIKGSKKIKPSKTPIKEKKQEVIVKTKKPEKKEKLGEKIDTYLGEFTKELKHQEKRFKKRDEKARKAVKSIDEEFEKLEKKPIEIKKKEKIKSKKKKPEIKKKQKTLLKTKKKKELKRKKKIKKVKIKKKAKKVKRKKVSKEKQKELDSWIMQRKLDLEKLKIDVKLLSLSPNPEDVNKLRDSIGKLKEMVEQKEESG